MATTLIWKVAIECLCAAMREVEDIDLAALAAAEVELASLRVGLMAVERRGAQVAYEGCVCCHMREASP